MRRFQLIEHTADMGLIAYGGSLAEAFANAAYGLFSIIAELKTVKETESQRVEISEEEKFTNKPSIEKPGRQFAKSPGANKWG